MLNPLLQTKLYTPRPKPRLVSRRRLLEKLDALWGKKLILISAPAGSGKSTLLAEWIQSHSQEPAFVRFAWLSLDSSDNTPARFLTYFVAALQKVEANIGKDILPLLDSIQTSAIETVWEALAAELVSIPSDLVLILDDYHVIQAAVIHDGLSYLLENLPPTVHLVVSTRADPPLAVARLRVQDELGEIRAADLRFNSKEVADFLGRWIGQRLSAADQAELENRTEGWIAGLQLAALAIQRLMEQAPDDSTGITTFIHRLSGTSRFIMDYLVEEVLARLPEDLRRFLLQTCIFERLTAPLCDVVTGRSDSQSILDFMEKANLFVFPLDDERRWFRYHHLFADLLFSFLQHDEPLLIPELHRKASTWYEGQGLMAEAIDHALKIPDIGEAARLMDKVAPEMLQRGEVTTIQSWSTFLTDEELRQSGRLCVCLAWALLLSDKIEQAEHCLSFVTPGHTISPASTAQLSVEIMAAYSMITFYRGNYELAIQYANQARKQIPPDRMELRAIVSLSSGVAYQMIGEEEAAFSSLKEARSISRACRNRTAELSTLKQLGDLEARQGHLHQAMQCYQQALQLGSLREGLFLPVTALTISAIGQILYEWGQLGEAERYSLQGIELARKLENTFALVSSIQLLARIRWTQGDLESAVHLRRESEQVIVASPPVPASTAQLELQQIRMYLQMGEVQAAAREAELYGEDWKSGYPYQNELMAILRARVWIAQGNPARAIQALKHVLPTARASQRWGIVIELLVLQALALSMMQQVSPALTVLKEALRLAEPESYYRIFVDEDEPMAKLLRMIYRLKEKGSREYETRLLEGLLPLEAPAQESTTQPLDHHPTLIDPLSERELEVLQLIAEGYSNQKIAENLVITLGTVKAHTSNIFNKLNVRSRTQAINRARELHLLKP